MKRCAVCVCISRTSVKKLASNVWHTREKLEGKGTAETNFTVDIHKDDQYVRQCQAMG